MIIKKKIPKKVRKEVWLSIMGEVYKKKCPVSWCSSVIDNFDFQVGHNIPESKGGKTIISNLIPICAGCNQGMGNMYTIDEWDTIWRHKKKKKIFKKLRCGKRY